MGSITAICSGRVPGMFRVPGTVESIDTAGLFRRSGQNCPNAHTCTHERIFLFFTHLFISLRAQVKNLGGTPEQTSIHAALRCSGYPEQGRNKHFGRNSRQGSE